MTSKLGLDTKDAWGRTPLHWAALNGHSTAVACLLKAGASSKHIDFAGETALEMVERRAKCSASERDPGVPSSVFGGIAKVLGGSGSTKGLAAKGIK